MKKVWWFCLFLCVIGCSPDGGSNSQWEGTYIGYYHRNQQDTIPLTLVFDGQSYAAAPSGSHALQESTGVFHDDRSALIFHNTTAASSLTLEGPYRYQFGTDGSIRIWKEEGDEMSELILRQR